MRAAGLVLAQLVGGLLLLGALEGATRLVRPTEARSPLVLQDAPEWEETTLYDPLLFWRMRPGIVKDGEPFTNSLGLRGPELPPEAEREFRILSLGESSTFARRVPHDASYSALLQARLGSVSGRPVRVLNAGVPGYTLFQGVTYLEHRGIELGPDAVISYFGFNDFLPIAMRDQRAEEADAALTDRELFEKRRGARFRLVSLLLEHSNLFRLLVARRGAPEADVEVDPVGVRVPAPDRRELLRALHAFCEDRGIRLVLVIPWYRDFDAHVHVLRRFAAESGVLAVDLPARFENHRRGRYFFDSVHPNREGHRLIAEAIDEELRQIWQVGSARAEGVHGGE